MAIRAQEAWLERPGTLKIDIPPYVREVVEEIAFQARGARKIDKRLGVSQRLPISKLEVVVSNAERRALQNGEKVVVPRVADVYAALPSITGKFELEYEGELRGAEQVARDLIHSAVGNIFTGMFDGTDTRTVVEWFDLGGSLQLSDTSSADEVIAQARGGQGLVKYKYTKYIGDELDGLDLEDLVAKLSDLLLASGFGNPYGMDDDERTMQALHDAILDALFNGGVLPEETIERLLGDPADGDQADARSKLEELIQQIIERMADQGYITTPPNLEPERQRR